VYFGPPDIQIRAGWCPSGELNGRLIDGSAAPSNATSALSDMNRLIEIICFTLTENALADGR
jgi:hypothetical protein